MFVGIELDLLPIVHRSKNIFHNGVVLLRSLNLRDCKPLWLCHQTLAEMMCGK